MTSRRLFTSLDDDSGSGEEEVMSRAAADILWEVASDLALSAGGVSGAKPARGSPLPPLLFFTDPVRTPRPWETAVRLPRDAGVVYRHFGAADARETCRRLREATRERGVRLLVGLDEALAAAEEADGVHLPERALDQADRLRREHPDWLLTGAVHGVRNPQDLRRLDAVVVSPVFPAGGASGARPPLGLVRFSVLASTLGRPVYALGGVSASNAPDLLGSGASGLAGVEAIQAAFAAA
jgi:thiamine-phosphate pyrophosphorylase